MPPSRPSRPIPTPPLAPRRSRPLRDPGELAEILRALPDALAATRTLKAPADGRSSVLALETPLGPIIAKTIALDTPKRRIQAWLHRTQLDRQAGAAALLARHGIPAAECLAILTGRDANKRRVRTLLARRVLGPTGLDLLRAGRVTKPLAQAAGRQVAALANLGLHDRDHKPSNLIVPEAEGDAPALVLIDPVGLRRRRPNPAAMLASLYLEPTGCGHEPSPHTRARVLRACAQALRPPVPWRRLQREAAQIILHHGDPTPRDLPPLTDQGRPSR
ncbi:MAG: hypothetical protein EA378_06565 [Phycisphaerales bacterium]|nr:MAG: hypothetical protein EA378_06565 [Phycisphaerales bacterium]